MESLQNLIANIPDWIRRLDDLSSQIAQRQIELARVSEPGPTSSPTGTPLRSKPVRNKGSTESLKPNDEGAAWREDGPTEQNPKQSPKQSPEQEAKGQALATSPTSPGASERAKLALQQQTSQVTEVAQARVRATLRKRNKRSDSIASAKGGAPKYRTRSMIIVYYDSYVQSFFEELVKFVSAQRNLMRKAKMAAKVARIKQMAELEMPDADENDNVVAAPTVEPPKVPGPNYGSRLLVESQAPIAVAPVLKPMAAPKADDMAIDVAPPSATDDVPALNYRRTLNMRSPGMLESGRPMFLRASGREGHVGTGPRGSYLSSAEQPPGVYDELDKGLEYVQSMCEHAAHQFLRDGDCNEEIENVKRRLAETKEQADREMERVQNEEPDALREASEEPPLVARSFRPQSMRKDVPTAAADSKNALSSAGSTAPGTDVLEVDEAIDDMDGDNLPTLMYKSSRLR